MLQNSHSNKLISLFIIIQFVTQD